MTETTQSLTFDEAIKAYFAGEIVEVKRYNLGAFPVWVPVSGAWCIDALKNLKGEKFRIRTRTINIGGVSVPKPLTVVPQNLKDVYIVTINNDRLCSKHRWGDSEFFREYLKRGLVHRTEEDALAHAKALIAISGGAV